MKDNFEKCFDMLLVHEGGFLNHLQDPAGATNLGVTKDTMQQYFGWHVSMGEMYSLTPEDVKLIYRKLYAEKVRFDDLRSGLDWAVLDWAVNSGTDSAAIAVQKFVGATQGGAIGLKTLQAVMNHGSAELIDKLPDTRQKFYKSLSHFKTIAKAGHAAMKKCANSRGLC